MALPVSRNVLDHVTDFRNYAFFVRPMILLYNTFTTYLQIKETAFQRGNLTNNTTGSSVSPFRAPPIPSCASLYTPETSGAQSQAAHHAALAPVTLADRVPAAAVCSVRLRVEQRVSCTLQLHWKWFIRRWDKYSGQNECEGQRKGRVRHEARKTLTHYQEKHFGLRHCCSIPQATT